MKKFILLAALSPALFAAAAFAGESPAKSGKAIVPPAPAPVYGTGFYLGIDAGVNAYQDFGGTHRFSIRDSEVSVEPREKVGFAGGIKAGYVFGTGIVRPAVEADLYYNGVDADLDARVNGHKANFNADGNLHSGAFMANFLLRFAFGRFQPYLGGGVGGYYAESEDIEVTIAHHSSHRDGGSEGGLAWQLVAGADYYFTEKWSTFLEYKFLNYEDAGFNEDRIGQQLVVLGLRWHF